MIRRNPNRTRYTIISNDALEDGRLSLAAVGLLAYVLSKPDNWQLRTADILKRGGIGRAAYTRIMSELEAAGYAKLARDHGPRGKLSGSCWEVSELPAATDCRENRLSENPTAGKPDCRENRLSGKPIVGKPDSIVSTDLLVITETAVITETPKTPENPRTPTSSAAKPDNQLATPPANAVGDTEPERRRPGRPRKDRPEGGEPDGAPRWQPVVAAIMAALGRPAPSGSRLPSWLGNTVRTFGAAAGDDPARALALVGEWRQSRQLRQALDGGFVSDHRIPAMVGAWIATTRPAARTAAPAAAGLEDAQMHRLGAPSNWREFVYTHDGTRRHPSLVLPSLGLEPYARPDTWPAWYRAVEGVPA